MRIALSCLFRGGQNGEITKKKKLGLYLDLAHCCCVLPSRSGAHGHQPRCCAPRCRPAWNSNPSLPPLPLHDHQPARAEQTRQAGSINGLIRVVLAVVVVAGIDFPSSLVWCDACAIRWLLKIMTLKEIRLWNAARRWSAGEDPWIDVWYLPVYRWRGKWASSQEDHPPSTMNLDR